MQAWHLLSWLKGAIITLFEHHFVTHSTSKLIGECIVALWLSTACQNLNWLQKTTVNVIFFCFSWSPHTFPSTAHSHSTIFSIHLSCYRFALILLINDKQFLNYSRAPKERLNQMTGRQSISKELEMMKILDCSLIHSTGSCCKFLTYPNHWQTNLLQLHRWKTFSDAGALSTPISTNPAGMAISSVSRRTAPVHHTT